MMRVRGGGSKRTCSGWPEVTWRDAGNHIGQDSVWPLARTASCWVLGEEASQRGVLATKPKEGDVFLVFSEEHQCFAHAGIVVMVAFTHERPNGERWFECVTIEGNTTPEGGRAGDVVARRRRTFNPAAGDRFIRCVDLDRR